MTNEIHENDMEPSAVRTETTDGDYHHPGQVFIEITENMKLILDLARDPRVTFFCGCAYALLLESFFFYIPVINNQEKCLRMDENLMITMLVLISVVDLFYIFNIARLIFHENLAYNSENRIMGGIWRSKWRIIIIDIACILPILPVVIVVVYFSKMRGSKSMNTINSFIFLVLYQFVMRILQMDMACREIFKNLNSSYIDRDVWSKRVFYIFLYDITIGTGQMVGALWYFFSVQREWTCWQYACKGNSMCNNFNFFCNVRNYDVIDNRIIDYLNLSCSLDQPSHFDFGMFTPAIQSGIVNSMNFFKKFFYCCAWGLRNLISFGSNLQTSKYFWENLFSIAITILGFVLFIYLVGNFQTYLQFSKDSEKMREKTKIRQVEIDDWIKNNEILPDMREEIVDGFRQKMPKKEDVNLKDILNVLSTQSRKHIKQRLCLPILKKVEQLQGMDDKLIVEIFIDYLKPMIFNEHSQILKEGDPLDQMLFFTQGWAWVYSTVDQGPIQLERGGFYGEDLLKWASTGASSPCPISHKTVKTNTKVEAFALEVQDVKNIARYFTETD